MNKFIVFYDINQINFYKYIPELLNELKRDQDLSLLLLYEETTNDYKALNFLNEFDCRKVCLLNSLTAYINSSTVLLVVNAQRIPDSLLIAYAKTKGVPTLMIQHGMYNGHLKRVHSLFIKKALKTIKYLLYSAKIGLIIRRNPIQISVNFIRTFVGYNSYKAILGKYDYIFADYIQVYGEYWIDYHKKFFGYNDNSKFQIVGYPELRNIKLSKSIEVCYIAQTIIEDGRGTYDDLKPTLAFLKLIASTYSLVIKRHPRSDNSLYTNKGLEVTDELPNADVYIGHYSSLLAIPISLNKRVIILPIKGHDIPEYFANSAHKLESFPNFDAVLNQPTIKTNINKVFSKPIEISQQVKLIKSYIK